MMNKSGHRMIGSSGDLEPRALDFRPPEDPITRSPGQGGCA
jgi:hypothetical protein